MIELILFAVYFLSAILSWRYVNLVYSSKGRWSTQEPGIPEILFTLIPVINSLFCLYGWIVYYPVKKEHKKINCSKFFNIKK